MLQRIVCFKFKESVSQDEIKRHMESFKLLKEKIKEIKHYSAGETISGDFGAVPEYDVMHYLRFDNEADIDKYFNHQKHKEFIECYKAIWDKVMVINSIITE